MDCEERRGRTVIPKVEKVMPCCGAHREGIDQYF